LHAEVAAEDKEDDHRLHTGGGEHEEEPRAEGLRTAGRWLRLEAEVKVVDVVDGDKEGGESADQVWRNEGTDALVPEGIARVDIDRWEFNTRAARTLQPGGSR